MTSEETIDPIKVLEEAAPYVFPGFKIDMASFDAARKHLNEDIGDNEWKGEKKEWYMTEDRNVAMANGYIGKARIRPTFIAWSVGRLMGKRFASFTVYYYGIPSEVLKRRFGYER